MAQRSSIRLREDTTNKFVEIFPNHSNLVPKMSVVPRETLFVGQNGSLIFQRTNSIHSGRYLCHVSNGIGHGLHQIFNLHIKGENTPIYLF